MYLVYEPMRSCFFPREYKFQWLWYTSDLISINTLIIRSSVKNSSKTFFPLQNVLDPALGFALKLSRLVYCWFEMKHSWAALHSAPYNWNIGRIRSKKHMVAKHDAKDHNLKYCFNGLAIFMFLDYISFLTIGVHGIPNLSTITKWAFLEIIVK